VPSEGQDLIGTGLRAVDQDRIRTSLSISLCTPERLVYPPAGDKSLHPCDDGKIRIELTVLARF
jgi:hypothetical protein